MAFINYATREINLKIVYYGAPSCGKAANFVALCQLLTQRIGEVVLLEREEGGMLFFNFKEKQVKSLPGFTMCFHLCAVPGQATNDLRNRILKGVDGIVFVVDSQMNRLGDNAKSMKNLQENLKENHLSLDQIPYVVQYNKRELPDVATINLLEEMFNNRTKRTVAFEAVATSDIGTEETLNAVIRLILTKYSKPPNAGG